MKYIWHFLLQKTSFETVWGGAKRFRETVLYLGLGIVTVLPFLARNVLLSGWLIYPFTRIDLFDVSWKIPKGLADYDAREIQVWGRGYTDVSRYDMPMDEWLPDWFRALAGSDRLFVLLAAMSAGILLLYIAGAVCGLWRRDFRYLSVQIAVTASFLFWLCTSPLMRYGCVWAYLTLAVVFGGIWDAARQLPENGTGSAWRTVADQAVTAAVVMLLVYKGFALGREAAASCGSGYWIAQKDYENYETIPYEIAGEIFYYPADGDQVGYESFPSAPVKADIEFLGEDIGNGFRAAERTGERKSEEAETSETESKNERSTE